MIFRGLSAKTSVPGAASLVLALCLHAPAAHAGLYLGVSPTQLAVKSSDGEVTPLMGDFQIGYQMGAHKLELRSLKSSKDDTLNELTVDVPTANSVLYRYSSDPEDSFNFDITLSYSQIEIESTYQALAPVTEEYNGTGFGFGMEESLQSHKQLRLRFEYMRLYKSNSLSVDALALGVRYVF